ncbi:MAG: hypothetical protein P8R54_09385 [Myxococcota bacterium]|nr:hypothetical protein [Myxococcota bacterium]
MLLTGSTSVVYQLDDDGLRAGTRSEAHSLDPATDAAVHTSQAGSAG